MTERSATPRGCRHHGADSPQARRRAQRVALIRAMQAAGVGRCAMAGRLCIAPKTLNNFIELYVAHLGPARTPPDARSFAEVRS